VDGLKGFKSKLAWPLRNQTMVLAKKYLRRCHRLIKAKCPEAEFPPKPKRERRGERGEMLVGERDAGHDYVLEIRFGCITKIERRDAISASKKRVN